MATAFLFGAVATWAVPSSAQQILAQQASGGIADCVAETVAAQRLACFERVSFIDAAMRFGAIHSVNGGCMARVREADRLACFEALVPRVAPITAPGLPAVTLRPPSPPQAAQPQVAQPPAAAPQVARPAAGTAQAMPSQPASPAPRQAQAPAAREGVPQSGFGRDGNVSGLYVRGEFGYAMGLDANIKDKPPAGTVIACLARGTGCGGELDKIGDSVSFGAGLGYRWNRQLRFDLTADYRPSFAVNDKDQATPFAANYKGDLTSLVGLVNAYWDVPVDLGQYASWLGRVHPWLGVGVGVARNRLDDLSYSQRLASGATATGKVPGASATGLAWQAGLGLGIDVLPNLVLDVGYRYLDAGDIKTKAGTVTDSVAGRLPVGEAKGDLRSHEMQMGLRYKL
jgi:opacity protein-like surface antigen